MKTLTSLTLMISIPMLVASIYGMNVDIPYSHTLHAFIFVMAISLLFSIAAVYILLKTDIFKRNTSHSHIQRD